MAENENLEDYLKKQLQNGQFKQYFENETTKLEIAISLTKLRTQAGLTQSELASISKVPQSTIAEIESGKNSSIDSLSKIASALGKKVNINFS
ncbi:helix-turn-helix domain-containing protein [Companilactobacillus zhongbaensis]|uniref:helix-turn-helix domain-containing protein n=1 Tax=Companilactobacillus zhongbaensis TaxID=2486009 RepID=UPI000F79E2B2|nr:helix-turn-helix transcriptional regulator [Companilactobacillus zhongbaensis]